MRFLIFLGVILPILGVSGEIKDILPQKTYVVTAYCNNHGLGCVTCNGKWAKYNKTADGHTPKQGITCAASRNIPFGTKIAIEGVGTRIVQDRLALKYDNRIDVYFNSHKDALKFGKKQLKVKIL